MLYTQNIENYLECAYILNADPILGNLVIFTCQPLRYS